MGEITVTLLGTGTPIFRPDRSGMSTLIQAGEHSLLFDCGRGAAARFHGVTGNLDVSRLFLTHLHSDHVSDIPDLWLSAYLPGIGARTEPLELIGPDGTREMAEHLQSAYTADFEARSTARQMQGFTDDDSRITGRNIEEGVVYQAGDLSVTAFVVDHGVIQPAFGFRVDFEGRSVVLSGDTRYDENLVRHANGADLLIHETAVVRPDADPEEPLTKRVLSAHTLPREVAEICTRTRPRFAVYSHIHYFEGATDEHIAAETRAAYDGPFAVGQDLDRFEVGDEVVHSSAAVG